MIRSKSVSICNHSRARLVDGSRNRTFSTGDPNLMRLYGGLLELSGSKLALLKSTFSAENIVCRLSWSISSDFGAFHSWNACGSLKSREKFTEKAPFLRFKVIDVGALANNYWMCQSTESGNRQGDVQCSTVERIHRQVCLPVVIRRQSSQREVLATQRLCPLHWHAAHSRHNNR